MEAQSERQSSIWEAYLILFSCHCLEGVLEMNIEFKTNWDNDHFSKPLM